MHILIYETLDRINYGGNFLYKDISYSKGEFLCTWEAPWYDDQFLSFRIKML